MLTSKSSYCGLCVLLHLSIVQYSEHCGVLIALTLLCPMREISLFISSELFGASKKPCQGKCVAKKKKKVQIEDISKLQGKY